MHGHLTPSTPNGRKAGDPISHSSEPDPGFAMVQAGYGNSAPLHLDIDTSMVNGDDGINAIVSLINVHEQMGGTLINLNCLSRKNY